MSLHFCTYGLCTEPGCPNNVSRQECPECGRVFDLSDENDSSEWYYGHDCEV